MPNKNSASRKKPTRQEQRDLDLEIAFLEGIVRKDPDYVEALQILGDDYTRRGRFEDGLKIDQQLALLRPEDPLVYYNLACSLSLTGVCEEALDALDRALDLGYSDIKWLMRDPDLRNVRLHTGYKRIRARLKDLKARVSS